MIVLQIVFWCIVLLVFHTYIGFPLILQILSRKKQNISFEKKDFQFVTIIMPLYNEESVIAEKLDSILQTDYPQDKLYVLIGSDNSTDRTNEIVREYAEKYPFITLYVFDKRQGKINIINRLVKKASTDIVVFSDANVMFDKNTIKELVSPFVLPEIGLVDSNMQNIGLKSDGISIPEKTYISREVKIKQAESILWGTMMGPFGGCFAMRKSLYKSVPQNFLVDDFYICMQVLQQGKKAINNINALAFEDVSNNLADEFHRKIRIATGNFQNLHVFKHFLLSSQKGLAFCFFSHKVLRWITPILLVVYYLINIILAFYSGFYALLFALFNLLFVLILLDFILKRHHHHFLFLRCITHFFSMNLALLIGMCRAIKGVKSSIWQPTARHQAK